jgi:TRAP-type C4-dicarboxylate transport system substrate-binding protein
MTRMQKTFYAIASWLAAAWLGAMPARAQTPSAPPVAASGGARYVLRMATTAPDGTVWGRELRAFTQEVENLTHGEVKVKMYFGGIAGDEIGTVDRMRRGQLDAVASGGMLCQQLSPSFRIMRLRGLYDSHDEAQWVLQHLKPIFDEEFKQRGYEHIGSSMLGVDVFFLRNRITSFQELKRQRLWRWNLDEVGIPNDRAIGMQVVPLPVEDAGRAYDDGQIDGFSSVPAAAVGFQWFSRAKYLVDLRIGYLWACMLIASRTFDRLPMEHRQALHAAAAKLAVRIDDVSRQQDALLLSSLFQKEGLNVITVTDAMRADFRADARRAIEQLTDKLVPKALLQKAQAEIERFRAAHKKTAGARP